MKWTSREFVAEMEAHRCDFERRWPSWSSTAVLDSLRAIDYGRLDLQHHVYLDYTGGNLYSQRQLESHFALLEKQVFGNPHSTNPSSAAMTAHVETARKAVLDYFNASESEYVAIFTPNASGALRLVGESYPFDETSCYLLTFDNHNSVNGIREYAKARGAAVTYAPVHAPDLRLDRAEMTWLLRQRCSGNRLFAFPAQSNFSGVQHPLQLVDEAQALGWDVLLDAAAFVPSNRLDLSVCKPEFVSLSFYKMFGYPTGVGCLLMRKDVRRKLRRPWFAGGTIHIASVQADGHFLAEDAAAFEDGTVDYLNLPAVENGLRHLDAIGMDVIHTRVLCLTGWLLEALSHLTHASGRKLVTIYGPADSADRGGTISFTMSDPDGSTFDIRRVQELASEANISMRSGCFCNPGAGEVAFGLTAEHLREFFESPDPMPFEELRREIHAKYGRDIGALRVSLGLASTFGDVYRFYDFARAFLDRTAAEVGKVDIVAGAVGWMRDSA